MRQTLFLLDEPCLFPSPLSSFFFRQFCVCVCYAKDTYKMEAVLQTQQPWFLQLSTLEKVCLRTLKDFQLWKEQKKNKLRWTDWFFFNWGNKCFSMTCVNHYDSNHICLNCMILIYRFEVINKMWINKTTLNLTSSLSDMHFSLYDCLYRLAS